MSNFLDEIRVRVRAGDGGDGAASFHREKFVPKGGPDGGDGGHGGSILLAADPSVPSLSVFGRRRSHRAPGGGQGGSNNRRGSDGSDVTLLVPVGTVVRDAATGELLADLAREGARFVAARGGRGGRGNAAMRSGRDRLPNYAEHGEPGEDRELVLELHLVADAGLLGPPNAGKSTLLAALTRADPKIADYPFTTIVPGLGVTAVGDARYVIADLPGLIEGASAGRGLGLRFLRHAERCSVLALVVDLASGDPAGELSTIAGEVDAYDTDLEARVRIVIGNKIDLENAGVAPAAEWASTRSMAFVAVSAALADNIGELQRVLGAEIERAREELGEPESFAVFRPVAADKILVTKEDGAFRVDSERVARLVAQTPLNNPRAVRRLQHRLKAMGVEKALKRQGAVEGDEVRIGGVAFEWFPDDPSDGARTEDGDA